MINPENKKPNWPAKQSHTSPIPKSNAGIPPRKHLPAINGLPGSTQPKPMKDFQNK